MVGDLPEVQLSDGNALHGLSDGSRRCRHCSILIDHRPRQAKFCCRECCLATQSAARKAARDDRPATSLTCRLCGVRFGARYKSPSVLFNGL